MVKRIRQASIYGFSIIELMVVMAIVSILIGIAVPNLRVFITEVRLTTFSNDLVSSINMARSEAVMRGPGTRVTITPNIAGDWQSGWTIFVDTSTNANGKISPSKNSNKVIFYYPAIPREITLTETNGANPLWGYISYDNFGKALVSQADINVNRVPNYTSYIASIFEIQAGGKTRRVSVVPPGIPVLEIVP